MHNTILNRDTEFAQSLAAPFVKRPDTQTIRTDVLGLRRPRKRGRAVVTVIDR